MVDPAKDFIRDYQSLAQQSWDAWARQVQQQQAPPSPMTNPFFTPPSPSMSGNDTLERSLSGMKGFFDWMQAAAAGGQQTAQPTDWRQQLQDMFGGAQPPFAQAFAGIESVGAEGFGQQWQSWMQAAQGSGFGELTGSRGPTPAFGLNREQQMQQQVMAAALMEAMQASARYQGLIQRANAQGMERMQNKLAEHAEPGRQIDSLKALYDLWVDAAEEAYAEIALSEEFREAYAEMTNTQMRVRQMQLQQTERICQQLGVPTRSEVAALGERLQAMRRELTSLRTRGVERRDPAQASSHDGEINRGPAVKTSASSGLKRKHPIAGKTASKQAGSGKVATKRSASKKAAAKKVAAKRVVVRTIVASKLKSKPKAPVKAVPGKQRTAVSAKSRSSSNPRK